MSGHHNEERGLGQSLCPGTASKPCSEDAGERLLSCLRVVVVFFFLAGRSRKRNLSVRDWGAFC